MEAVRLLTAISAGLGPLTSDALAQWLVDKTGSDNLAFFDAAAPVVMADSLDMDVLFRQSRYEQDAPGDYLNAPEGGEWLQSPEGMKFKANLANRIFKDAAS